ncbi:hypothetical protein LMG28614_04940 [Paraburkholderia ultramafica]|uniref:Lysozyme inhibitor LprI-like N-terminal domain-containing protein n=1 Tax=Paraburkholderia ultramafica TaxID=1544867 RepID=A0A6S7BU21_9BURK|nr:lysozyme inhibitor LprI family protein [Paraburkholderia ultramafica]CAB3799323.1 hypothetical protein LMG28614_04940 [Paraburkholderia ultramafica]
MSTLSRSVALVSGVLLYMMMQSALPDEPAATVYKLCRDKPSAAEQRDCYPAVVRHSEIELAAAEKKVRAGMVELEKISEGSRATHPVRAFGQAERAFRTFRDAESNRALAAYGSGNGGGLAVFVTIIEMNIARANQLTGEAGPR